MVHQALGRQELLVPFQHPNELPCRMRSDRWRVAVEVDQVPAFGTKCFVARAAEPAPAPPGIVTGDRSMENEHLALAVNDNGTFDLTWKQDGTVYRGLNLFHDQGEVGDPWVGAFPEQDRIVTSETCTAQVEPVENGPLSGALVIRLTMDLPVAAAPDRSARLSETTPVAITSVVRLRKGERFVRIETTIENVVQDHILRVFFPTDIPADTVQVEMPFDVVTRAIEHPDTTGWREPYRPVQPQRSFVDITDGACGFALINAGNGQYEAVDSPRRELALTLLRCFRQWNSIRVAEYPDQTGSQCQGTHTFAYALCPHVGDWMAGEVLRQSRLFNLPMKTAAGGPGAGDLPPVKSFVELDDPRLDLAAIKKGEWDDSLVLRVVNPTDGDVSATLTLGVPVASAERINLKETESLGPLPCEGGRISLDVPGKKILTLRLST